VGAGGGYLLKGYVSRTPSREPNRFLPRREGRGAGGKQKLRTKVIKKNTNPEWSEELTLSIEDPAQLHILSGWYASPSVSFLPSFPESICLNLFTHTPSNLKKDIQIMHE